MIRRFENIRILIVEDEPVIARDISDFLEEIGFIIADVCYDADAAIESLDRKKSDICILDINLGKGSDGIALAQKIKRKWQIPFIYLTSYTDDATITRAKETMPYGYISKPIQFDSLKSTIEIALHNAKNRNEPRPLTQEIINNALIAELTPREFELLKDIYEGKTNKQLAEIHFISLSTVKTHVHRIYDKFDCHTRPEVIAKIRNILSSQHQ